jgi:hypothetical protein
MPKRKRGKTMSEYVPDGNCIGMFSLPGAYAADDLQVAPSRRRRQPEELHRERKRATKCTEHKPVRSEKHCSVCGRRMIVKKGWPRKTCGNKCRQISRKRNLKQSPLLGTSKVKCGRPLTTQERDEQFSSVIRAIMKACLRRIDWRGMILGMADFSKEFLEQEGSQKILRKVIAKKLTTDSRINSEIRSGPRAGRRA